MNNILKQIKILDKRKLLIYLFSYAFYRIINNFFSFTVLHLFHEENFQENWSDHSVPCGTTPHALILSFQVFKIILFVFFINFLIRKPEGLVKEFFIAYFIYDLVYILSFIWELIPFPFNLNTWWTLNSSGQIFLAHYFRYLDLIFAGLWSIALLLALFKHNKLSLKFMLIRLVLIPISVPLIYRIIFYLEN